MISATTEFSVGTGCFAFPALDISAARPINRRTSLVSNGQPRAAIVCSTDNSFLCRLAADLQSCIETRAGVRLPIRADTDIEFGDGRGTNLIILGGSHQNRLARSLGYHHLFHADRSMPGRGGYLIHTLHGLFNDGSNQIGVACDEGSRETVVSRVRDGVEQAEPGQWTLKRLHAVQAGNEAAGEVQPADVAFRAVVPGLDLPYEGFDGGDESVVRYVREQYDSGGFEENRYNLAGVYAAVKAFQIWQLTAERTFLDLFKALLWGLVDYHLATPGGAS